MHGIVTFLLAGVFLLVPVQFLVLPLNMSLADVFGFAALPLCWVFLLHARQRPVMPLAAGMWAILGSACLAVMFSIDPSGSVTSLAKEIYLYFWFATVCTVLVRVDERGRRFLLLAWCVAAYGNGALIVLQFLDPSLLASMNSMVAGVGALDLHRPSGLMENSNAAALFQLSAFVPLVALRPSRARLLVFGVGLLLTVLGTGSMGALVAFTAALGAGLLGMGVLLRDWRNVVQFGIGAVLSACLLAGVVFVLMQTVPSIDDRIHYVLTGRGEGSAEGRFEIWTRGIELFLAELHPFGVGPDMFKRIGGVSLHNDVLAFGIERGPLGLFALILFGWAAAMHAVGLAQHGRRQRDPALLVFFACLVGFSVLSLTHEIFHQRPVWMVLALQEATWWRAREQAGQLALPTAIPTAVHERAVETTRRTVSMT